MDTSQDGVPEWSLLEDSVMVLGAGWGAMRARRGSEMERGNKRRKGARNKGSSHGALSI